MRKGLFWLNDKQWVQIERAASVNEPDGPRARRRSTDHQRYRSHAQCGARWRDCPPDYGPYTTIYNRFNCWAKRGHWKAVFETLARCGKDGATLSIDSTSIKAHRSASGGKGEHE
ncbi:IS5 family transposase [Bradyrhizobium sp. 31Argb]|uniref:IS5 family transposase n=1 Tax=Bradyrhizobium TaxID=374 RepID=UPI0004216650|nr:MULTISPECIES: IS5 family transposase [Bradyrhizobium]